MSRPRRTGRPEVMSTRAMVCAAHPLATAAGLQVLQQGGHAVDAAITVNAVLQVTQPQMCGLGGDLFALLYDAASGRVTAVNGSGRSPRAANPDDLLRRGIEEIPEHGVIAANVPGCLDAWLLMHQRHGRLPFAQLLEPAIHYAAEGFPVSRLLREYMSQRLPILRRFPSTMSVLCPQGELPEPGSLLRQPELAGTLRLVATGGRQAFYEGPVAEAICAYCAQHGGWLTLEDFRDHHSFWTEPIETTYRGLRVLAHPPNSQGFALLMELNLLEESNHEGRELLSPELIDLLVRIKNAAFRQRDRHNTDPEHTQVPVSRLVSKAYAKELTSRLEIPVARDGLRSGDRGDTTYFCLVDEQGNAASVIQSIFHAFGCSEMAAGTGLFLQNRMSAFSLRRGDVNRLEPGKRTAHTLCPALVLDGDRLALLLGTMGGDGQPQTLLQLLNALLDHGCGLQEAIELPRWRSDPDGALLAESRLPHATLASLRRLGHRVQLVAEWGQEMGHAQMIRVFREGVLCAAADPRGDGFAMGY